MRYEIINNLVTKEECDYLNSWVDLAVSKNWLDSGVDKGQPYPKELRRTSRFYGDRFEHPELALKIFDRIREKLQLFDAPLVTGHGRDGIVINYTLDGGNVYEHIDGKALNGMSVLRCNLLSRKSVSGGELFIDGVEHPMYETSIHCYLVSEHTHRVETVYGDIPRVLWMFGFAINAEDWNSGKIKVQQ